MFFAFSLPLNYVNALRNNTQKPIYRKPARPEILGFKKQNMSGVEILYNHLCIYVQVLGTDCRFGIKILCRFIVVLTYLCI
jgi:hypothetical protein